MTRATLLALALFSSCCSAGACFASRGELLAAVDIYVDNPSPTSSAALTYGHPIGTWCVSAVTSLDSVFSQLRNSQMDSFNEDISAWDVSSVINMRRMFRNASSFNQPLNTWDVSSVTNMQNVFREASAFNQPLDAWDVNRVTDMYAMFHKARSFNQPLGSWDVSSVREMAFLFSQASAFNQPMDSWDVSSAINTYLMFEQTPFNQPLGSWDVSNVVSMRGMFWNAPSFSQDLCAWGARLQPTTNVDSMFSNSNCPFQTSPDLTDTPPGPFCAFCGSTQAPTTRAPTTRAPTTRAPTTRAPTTRAPTTRAPTTRAPTTRAPSRAPTSSPSSLPSSLPSASPSSSPTTASTMASTTDATAASMVPPFVETSITLGSAVILAPTNVTRGSTVFVQGTLEVLPGSQINVGDGSSGAVFQATEGATISGGSANVALSQKPPPGTPVTVKLIEGAFVSGSFDDIKAGVPNYDPTCESLSVEQQNSGTSISAVITLTSTCGLSPGVLAGIIAGSLVAGILGALGVAWACRHNDVNRQISKDARAMRIEMKQARS